MNKKKEKGKIEKKVKRGERIIIERKNGKANVQSRKYKRRVDK